MGATGLGATGFGATGLGATGLGATGFGATGFGKTGGGATRAGGAECVAGVTRFFFAVGATVTFAGEGRGGRGALVVVAAGVVDVGAVEVCITVAAVTDRFGLALIRPWIWKVMTTTRRTMRAPNAISGQFSRLFTDPL